MDDSKASAFSFGLQVHSDTTIRDVAVKGFNFPCKLVTANNVTIESSEFAYGLQWGLELDNSTGVVLDNIHCHSNGLDGLKLQSQEGLEITSSSGTRVSNSTFENNGLRDFAAGGFEDSNGNGVDLFDGGLQTSFVGCISRRNYGCRRGAERQSRPNGPSWVFELPSLRK